MSHARTALAVFVAALLGCGGGTGDQGGGDSERGGQDASGQTEREPAGSERRDAERGETGRVTRVIDGDTVELESVGRVRLIGVDTPERGEECFDEATAYLKDRVGGQTVRYRYQSEREDRYDRALLDLFRDDELVNLDIAQAGWGEALTIQPNDRYADRIIDAEVEARAAPRGRSSGCLEEPEPNRDSSPPPGEERRRRRRKWLRDAGWQLFRGRHHGLPRPVGRPARQRWRRYRV